MNLIQFTRVLLKRKLLLIAVPLLMVLVTYYLTRNMPDIFRAEAQIATGITEKSHISLEESKGSVQLIDIQQQFSNVIEQMRSKKIMDVLSCQLLLHDLESPKSFRPARFELVKNSIENKDEAIRILKLKIDSISTLDLNNPKEKEIDDAINKMGYDEESIKMSLKVSRVENSDFVKAVHESESSYLSVFIVNHVCSNFIDYYRIQNQYKRTQTADFFAKMAEEKKRDLDQKVEILKQYKIKNKVINLGQQTENLEILRKDVELMREKVNQLIPSYTVAIKDINSKLSGEDRAYLEVGLQPMNKKISSTKKAIYDFTELLVKSGNKDEAVKDSISRLRTQLEREILKAADDLVINPNVPKQDLVVKKINYELDLEIAIQSVKSIDNELRRLDRKFETFTPLDATIQAYERDIQVAADAYLVILNKLNEASFYTNLGINVEQTQTAQIGPPEPSKKMMLLVLAGIIGLVLTIVILFVLEYLDLTLKTPEKFVKITGLPLIGALNRIKSEKLDLKTIFNTESVKPETDIFKKLLRTLRHEVEEKMRGHKVLLFTSTGQGDGKTLSMISLAFSLGISGKKVLMVDTNFYNNSISKTFLAKPALEDFLNSKSNFKDAVTDTSIENVKILGSRGGRYSPNEVMVNTVTKEKISEISKDFDLVFLEGDNLNTGSGAKELTYTADKVIGIFSADNVIEQADRNSIDYLKEIKSKYIGSVLNRVELENLENMYGETEKRRGFIRKFIKRILRRNLSKKRKDNSNLMKS